MQMRVVSLPALEDLGRHVHVTLCQHDSLAVEQTPMVRVLITRLGRPCGLFFQVSGPRLLKAYAIWAGDEDRILFYDCNGQRFAETRLSEGPDVQKLETDGHSDKQRSRAA
jgi:hypothetical protein